MPSERVNIMYTVELEEVLNEISSMIDYISHKIGHLNDNFSQEKPTIVKRLKERELYNVHDFLNETRLNITNIDHRLNDCARLVHGYNSYLVQKQQTPQQQPSPEQQEHAPAGDIEDIQQRIASLKSAIESPAAERTDG